MFFRVEHGYAHHRGLRVTGYGCGGLGCGLWVGRPVNIPYPSETLQGSFLIFFDLKVILIIFLNLWRIDKLIRQISQKDTVDSGMGK
jgi:hypothetical protein